LVYPVEDAIPMAFYGLGGFYHGRESAMAGPVVSLLQKFLEDNRTTG
jgi:hypothetical protein